MSDLLTTLTKRVLFSPLDEPGRTEKVVSRIRSAITLGIFANGEQLPNEIELARQLSISPVTLRDALRVIRAEGLVRTTRGRSGGTFVIAPDESNMKQFERALADLPQIELRDMLDWQAAIVGQAARLAAQRASSHDTASLAATISGLSTALDAPTARRAGSRFLIELAASSRSGRISKAAITLQIELAPHWMLVFRDPDTRAHSFSRGRDLVAAVAEREAATADEAAIEFTGFVGDRIMELHYELSQGLLEAEGPVGA
jgi:DNA-binding FadR family transcriptional regulator